jgi:hypothetical protein
MAETWLLAMRCPGYRWRDSNVGSGMELENLFGGGKGKGTSGSPARPNLLIRRAGADCPVVARKRSNVRGAKGAGHSRHRLPGQLGNRRSRLVVSEGGSSQLDGTSRVTGDSHARFRERLGVIVPGATREAAGNRYPYRDQPAPGRRGRLSSRCARFGEVIPAVERRMADRGSAPRAM